MMKSLKTHLRLCILEMGLNLFGEIAAEYMGSFGELGLTQLIHIIEK